MGREMGVNFMHFEQGTHENGKLPLQHALAEDKEYWNNMSHGSYYFEVIGTVLIPYYSNIATLILAEASF